MIVFSSWPFAQLALQELVLDAHLAHLDRVADDELDLVVLRVLDQVLERAEVHGVDRRLLRGVRGHDHDRQRWVVLLDAACSSWMPSMPGILISVMTTSKVSGLDLLEGVAAVAAPS